MTNKPPKCPNCKKHLDSVDEVVNKKYTFKEDTGEYDEGNVIGSSIRIICPYCGEEISGGVFPDGVCNYNK